MTSRQDSGVAVAKPSATIVILRDGEAGPEVLLVLRRAGAAFGNSYAFPGGVVDANEPDATKYSTGLSETAADATLETQTHGLNYYSAGIRELFEETGLLLARTATGSWANCDAGIQEQRIEVDRGNLPWTDFLRQHGLTMAFDALHYFAHWETPLVRPLRWTTRFFLAMLPPGQHVNHDGNEITDSCWLAVDDAPATCRNREMEVPYPTLKTLEMLQDIESTRNIAAWAEARQQAGIVKNRPDHVVFSARK